jgi:uncharacterized protein YqeY
MDLFDQLKTDMYAAMKSGEKEKASALRIVISKLKDRQIEKREDLNKEEILKVLRTLEKQRKESVEQYRSAGRDELADAEQIEADLINTYLPKMMDEMTIRTIVEDVIKETGAESMSDVGKVLPVVLKRGANQIDGKQAPTILRDLLD